MAPDGARRGERPPAARGGRAGRGGKRRRRLDGWTGRGRCWAGVVAGPGPGPVRERSERKVTSEGLRAAEAAAAPRSLPRPPRERSPGGAAWDGSAAREERRPPRRLRGPARDAGAARWMWE